jgi:hypothetical protein
MIASELPDDPRSIACIAAQLPRDIARCLLDIDAAERRESAISLTPEVAEVLASHALLAATNRLTPLGYAVVQFLALVSTIRGRQRLIVDIVTMAERRRRNGVKDSFVFVAIDGFATEVATLVEKGLLAQDHGEYRCTLLCQAVAWYFAREN